MIFSLMVKDKTALIHMFERIICQFLLASLFVFIGVLFIVYDKETASLSPIMDF